MSEPIVDEAVEFLRIVSDAETNNRANAYEDLKFRYGDQWPTEIMNSRRLESRPCLTINEIDSYCRQVANQQRQQRPRIKVHPVNSTADVKIAEVISGITRHIEVNSDADNAYDTAFDFAISMGWGYWRIRTDYIREDSFDQDIFIDTIVNPFTIYFDPDSQLPDGSDAKRCLVTDVIPRKTFELLYPTAQVMANFNARATGDVTDEWVTKDDVRIAEFFKVEEKKERLVMLSDKSIVWANQLPKPEILQAANVSVVGDRESCRRYITWNKVSGFEVLDKKEWAGRYIPIVPVYGNMMIDEGKIDRFGLVRFGKDPQRMINFWQTAITESLALAPKAKWLMAEGQDEGHEAEWMTANVNSRATLRYKSTDVEGRAVPPPQRLQPEPPPEGLITAAMGASSNLQKVVGIFDPAMRNSGNVSGKALNAERQQSDNSNFHFYDNLTRSIKHTGRIILDLIPHIYDTERVLRIIGDDERPKLITINEKKDIDGIQKVLNDVTVGLYDVVMDTGPGYNTKRQESVDTFTAMLGTPLGEKLAQVADDVIVRQMDVPGAEVIADRLAAANPLSKIDEDSEVPPQAQMMIQQLQQQLQQAGQQIQALGQELKFKQGIVQMQEDGANKRKLMEVTAKAHDTETWATEERDQFESVERTRIHDTNTRALSAQHVEEIRGMVQLLLKRIDAQALGELQ